MKMVSWMVYTLRSRFYGCYFVGVVPVGLEPGPYDVSEASGSLQVCAVGVFVDPSQSPVSVMVFTDSQSASGKLSLSLSLSDD